MKSAGPSTYSPDFSTIDALIDWDLARATTRRLMSAGPAITSREASDVVSMLHDFAAESTGHVRSVTGMVAEPGEQVYVVNRESWASANLDSFRYLLADPIAATVAKRKKPTTGVSAAVGRRVTGAEMGSILVFLGTRVLGQFDPFLLSDPTSSVPGRLMLVAPNIVYLERDLGVDARDFRLWVCLHEETHRVQFSANPWLRSYIMESVQTLIGDALGDPGEIASRISQALRQLPDVVRDGSNGLLDLIQSPAQREALRQVTAVMSLLEGHADVVMDEVGPSVIPSVDHIRSQFTRYRSGRGPFDQFLRRALGLDAKMRQYADGAAFVRGVLALTDMDGFNKVWTSPDTLPTADEIAQPAAWVERVLS